MDVLLVKSNGLGHMFEQGSVPERVLATGPFLGAAALKAEGLLRVSLASFCVKLREITVSLCIHR